jgi:hypothetical protein
MIEKTKERLREILHASPDTAVLASFGKDSLTILLLLEEMGMRRPVVHFTEPAYPWKQDYANFVISTLGLEVYTPPPLYTAIRSGEKENCLVRHYRVGEGTLELPLTLEQSVSHCGASLYNRPHGDMLMPWTSYLVGHKSSDVDATYGNVRLKSYSQVSDTGTALHFPLRDWTDEDIWAYLSTKMIAQLRAEYEARTPFMKNDCLQACTLCMFPSEGKVFCPKLRKEIDNCSSDFTVIPKRTFNYFDQL